MLSKSGRRRSLLFLAGVIAVLAAVAGVAFAASRGHAPRALNVVCAEKGSGLLRYATKASACHAARENAIDFVKDAPVYTCIRPDAANGIAHASRDKRGRALRVVASGKCGNDVQLVLPGRGPRSFCVDIPTRLLRNVRGGTPCHAKGEFKVILAKRKPKPAPGPKPEPEPEPGKHAPVAVDDAASTDEDHGTAIAATANDSDPDGDPIHVASLQTTGLKGTAHIAADGKIAYDPNGAFESLKAGQTAHDTFAYKLSDGNADSAPATVDVTVSGVNDLPVGVADSATTDEDSVRTLHVLDNDTDVEGDALHVASVDTTGTKGSVSINSDGTIAFDPNGQFAGLGPGEQATDSFTYKANDGHGDSGSTTVFLTITGVNHAPVLSAIESAALSYDTGSGASAITGSLAVSDVDDANVEGATVAIATGYVDGRDLLSFTDQGTITGVWDHVAGVLTLSGSATKGQYETALRSVGFEASDPTPSGTRRIDFVVNDGDADSNTQSRDVTVTHVNHAPVAQDDAAATNANATKDIAVLGNDTDSDLDTLSTASVDTTGTKGSVSINSDGTIAYDPNGQFDDLAAGDTAQDSFTYKANDGSVDSNAATVTVTVTGVNNAPVLSAIEADPLSYDTGSGPAAITDTLAVSDVDTANLTWARVVIATGHSAGHDALSFTAQPGISGAFDDTSGALTLSGSSSVANYQAALRSVQFATDAATDSGSRTISFQVDDGETLDHASALVTRDITIQHVNHAPTVADDSGSTDENTAAAPITVLANDGDVDGDAPLHVASVDTTGTKGAVTINADDTIGYDPNGKFEDLAAGATADDTFTYKAADPANAESSPATVTVTITGVNDAPALTGIEDSALAYDTGSGGAAITDTLAASDVDDADVHGATVQITDGYVPGTDTLAFAGTPEIAAGWDSATATLTLSGDATKGQYQAALRAVTFAADATTPSGTRTIAFQIDDGHASAHASNTVMRDITVSHVNHAPTPNADSAATDEDSAISSVSVLGNDSDVDGDSPLHVSAIDTTGTTGDVSLVGGTISYSPAGHFDALAEGATATDSFKYKAADPSDAESDLATVTVTVTGVNDAPVLANAGDTALAYSSDQAATAVSPTITATDVDNANLTGATIQIGSGYVNGKDVLSFANTPQITGTWAPGTGTLTLSGATTKANYATALHNVKFKGDNASGVLNASRSVSFQTTDGALTSTQVFRTIDVTHVNEAPTAVADSVSGALGNTMLAVSTSVSGPHTSATGNVLNNDTDPDNAHSGLTATVTSPTPNGAKVTMNSDGTFSYVPPQGFTGDDTFQYTVHDNDSLTPKTADGTVTVTVGGPRIWYVDADAAAGGDGRSDAPFNTLAPLSTGGSADGKDGSGDKLFLYDAAATYTGGIVLEANQELIGQPQGLTVSGNVLVPAAGSNAKIANASGPAITLATSGNKLQHVDATSSGGPAVAGTNVDTATVDAGTTLSGTNGGVAISGGSGAISIGSAISTTGGHSVSVQNRTGGTVTFDGTVTDTGAGVLLFNNGTSAVAFTKTITASTGTSPAFSATGAGTVSATAPGSTLATTTGIALDVRNNTIASGGLKFQSIAANGAQNGIKLDTTGTAGSLTVSGTGAASTGGTIQNTTGHGISLNDTQGVSLTDIRIQNPQHAGIKGAKVHGFALIDSTVTGAGAALSDTTDSSLAFNDTSAAAPDNLDGVLTLTGNTLSGAYGGGIDVANYSGTISDATISNNTISSSTNPATSKGSGIAFDLFGTTSTVASLTRASITSNTVTNFPSGDGISVQGGNTSGANVISGTYGVPSGSVPGNGANIVDISSNHVTGDATNKLNGAGISASVTGRGQGNFSITNNGGGGQPITNVKAEAIALGAAGTVNANFLVTGNTAVANSVLGSAGIGLGTDINQQADLSTNTSDTPVVNADIRNNSISASSGPGIRALTRDSKGTTSLRVRNNTVGNPAQAATAGIRFDAGSSGGAAYDPTVCADVGSNTSGTGPANGFGDQTPGIVLFKRSASATTYKFGLTGISPSPATAAQAESYVAASNSASAVGAGFYAGKKASVVTGDQFTSCSLPFP